NRSTRRVALSDQGRNFLEHARRLVETADTVVMTARNLRQGLSHCLRLGAAPYRAADRWAILNRFLQSNPDVALQVVNENPAALISLMDEGKLDLAFMYGAVPERFEVAELWSYPIGIVLPA